MQVSGRNQLEAEVVSITLGDVMAEVLMRLDGGQELVAAITRSSVERMNIQPGDRVFALVKATEVMVGKP